MIKKIDKDEWFDYFKKKFIDNEEMAKRVNIKPEVFNIFYETLNDEDLIYYDKYTNVKISPRKWEQLLLYINTALPITNKEEAQILTANVKNYFKNYQTGITSNLFKKVLLALKDIIKQTSNIDLEEYELDVSDKWVKVSDDYEYKLQIFDWKKLFKQQLEVKIKLDSSIEAKDELRKFVPIIQSPIPSVTIKEDLEKIAKEFDLELIFEPIFNGETLLEKIKNIKTITNVKGQGKYKYLVVLDEIYNIDDDNFFYKLKEDLLNKDNILDDVLIVFTFDSYIGGMPKLAANDTLVEIADIIEARPNWKDLEKNILNNTNREYIEKLGFNLEKAVFETLKLIFSKFRLNNKWDDFYGRVVTEDENLFYLKVGYNRLYIPPKRIYEAINSISKNILFDIEFFRGDNEAKSLEEVFEELLNESKEIQINYREILNSFSKKDQEKFYNAILEKIYQEFESFIIPNTTTPLRINEKNSLKILKEFIFTIPEVKAQFKGLFEKVEYDDIYPLSELIQRYETNIDSLIDSTHIFNYIEINSKYPTKVFTDFIGYVKEKIDYINKNFKDKTEIIYNKELPLDGYNGVLLYTNILKIEKAILDLFEDFVLNEEELYFLFEFANAIKVIANLMYKEIDSLYRVTSELLDTEEIKTQKELAQYISNFFKDLGINIELEEIFNKLIGHSLKTLPPKGYFRRIRKINDSFLYDEN